MAVKNLHPQSNPRQLARTLAGCLFLCFLLALSACSGSKKKYPSYSPHENILSIAAEFQLLASLDPYRDPVGRDLSGASIARSTLVRAANYESLHPGRFAPEVLTVKARALELLGDYRGAQRNYLEAGEYETELRPDNLRRAAILDRFLLVLSDPGADDALEAQISRLALLGTEFRQLASQLEEEPYKSLALVEAEGAETARAELLAMNRFLLADGENQALSSLEALVDSHRESTRSWEHALRLAAFHRDIAQEELRIHPPERLAFNSNRFKRHYDAAVDLYYRISQADGRPERLIARHELDAMLAFGEYVSRRMR